MNKNKNNIESSKKVNEIGITHPKIARMYGVNAETLKSWIVNNEKLEDELDELNWEYKTRKLTPKQLEKIFEYLGDPREYQDIIG